MPFMRNITSVFAILFLSLVIAGGVPRTFAEGPAAQGPASAESYYPPSESAGGWRRCSNDEEVRELAGMDPQKLDQVGRVTEALYGGPWVLVVIRHGYLVREWFGVPAMPQTTYDVWSSTKSATGIAYGLLLDDSRNHRLPNHAQIDLDSKAYSFIPEGYPLTDPRKAEITIRQLLTMTSGIPGEGHGVVGLQVTPGGGEFEIALGRQRDRLGGSAARLYADPGEGWDYSDAAFSHLSLIFKRVTGQEIGDFMRDRVFRPIGIQNSSWDLEGGGGNIGPHTNAHSGLHLSGRDFARLGYLLLHDGNWQGKQIVPKSWLDLATKSSQSLNPSYGYTFWVNTDGKLWPGVPMDAFAFMGYATNRCYVVPSLDLVVVRLGYGPTPIGPVEIPLTSIVATILK
jgi:CubicO group peptidase (beta-lactamase class C family)